MVISSSTSNGTELDVLRERLREAEETIDAIRAGAVDAVIVDGHAGEQVYTLVGADEPYRHLVEQMGDGALTLNRAGTILYANGAVSRMLRTPLEQVIGRSLDDFLVDDGAGALERAARNDGLRADAELRRPGGGIVPVFLAIEPLREGTSGDLCATITDLTHLRATEERLRMQEELVRSEHTLRLALRAAEMGTFNVCRDERRVEASEGAYRHFGLDFGPGRTTSLDDFLGQLAEGPRGELAGAIASAQPAPAVQEILFERPGPGGERRILRWQYSCVRQDCGAAITGVLQDVTPQQEAEAQLRRASQIKDEFLGLVSHELRTPLTTVVGLARHLARPGASAAPADQHEIIMQISQDAERLQGLIENMLILARLDHDTIELEPVQVVHAAEQAIAVHRERFPARAVSLRTGPGIPPVLGVEQWVVQVVGNLLSNAEKYSERAGAIDVHIDEAEAGAVAVRVSDRGQGISADDAAKVFDPFFRSSWAAGRSQGLGLGLAVCRRLVDLQGGVIAASPRPGGGTEVRFTLRALDA